MTLRARCVAMLDKIRQNALMRQGDSVNDMMNFVLAERGRAADPILDKAGAVMSMRTEIRDNIRDKVNEFTLALGLYGAAFCDGEAEEISASCKLADQASERLLGAIDDGLTILASPFQSRVLPWLLICFGEEIANDRVQRNHRFLEEALEGVQALGCTADEAHQLVDYVFGRPIGEPNQEVGGIMVTLGAMCLANGLDMHQAGEIELARIWTRVEQIRTKQATKPQFSPLPGVG